MRPGAECWPLQRAIKIKTSHIYMTDTCRVCFLFNALLPYFERLVTLFGTLDTP